MRTVQLAVLSVTLLALSSTTVYAHDNGAALVGGLIGGTIGAMVGQNSGGQNGALVGAVLGGATGVVLASADHDHGHWGHDRWDGRPYGERVVEVQRPAYGYGHPYGRDWHDHGGDHRRW